MTTHPHLEGLTEAALDDFCWRVFTNTCTDDPVLRERIRQALAALPGGGVEVAALVDAAERMMIARSAGNVLAMCHAAERIGAALKPFQKSPTPLPHEADRNG